MYVRACVQVHKCICWRAFSAIYTYTLMSINALTRITVIYAHVTAHNKYTTVEPVHLFVHRCGVTYQYPL